MLHIGIIVGLGVVALIALIWFIYGLPVLSFWFRYTRVKMAQGGLCLVKWRSKTGDYWKIGHFGKLVIEVKKRNSKHKTEITIPEDRPVFYRLLGVNCVDVDEQKNALITVSFEGIEGFDEETYENIIIRALMNPRENINWKILLIAIAIIIIAVIADIVLQNNEAKKAVIRHNQTITAIADYCLERMII